MKLYHQTGFRYKWNIDSQNNNGHGSGIIFSPVDIPQDKLEDQSILVRQKSFLDPQIYLPTSSAIKEKLKGYDYFPSQIRDGFTTSNFKTDAMDIAAKCVDLQMNLQFKYIVIPTRYYEVMPSDYIDRMNEEYVEPFTEYLSSCTNDTPVLLTLVLNSSTLKDENKRNDILNWVTGLTSQIDGIYLIIEHNGDDKQIKDYNVLLETLKFIHILRENDLEVHVGYCNTEGLLYSVADPSSITMGSYENLRNFGVKRFEESDNSTMRGPKARLYISKLFQWVSHEYFPSMQDLYSRFDTLIDKSPYIDECFDLGYEWHFTKKGPYLHYFDVYSKQVKALADIKDMYQRIKVLKEQVNDALHTFATIEASGIRLNPNSDGSHLNHWYSVLTMFEKHLEND